MGLRDFNHSYILTLRSVRPFILSKIFISELRYGINLTRTRTEVKHILIINLEISSY